MYTTKQQKEKYRRVNDRLLQKVNQLTLQKKTDKELLDSIVYSKDDRKSVSGDASYVKYEKGKISIKKITSKEALSDDFSGCLMAIFKIDPICLQTCLSEYDDNFLKEKFDSDLNSIGNFTYVSHVSTDLEDNYDCKQILLYGLSRGLFKNFRFFKPFLTEEELNIVMNDNSSKELKMTGIIDKTSIGYKAYTKIRSLCKEQDLHSGHKARLELIKLILEKKKVPDDIIKKIMVIENQIVDFLNQPLVLPGKPHYGSPIWEQYMRSTVNTMKEQYKNLRNKTTCFPIIDYSVIEERIYLIEQALDESGTEMQVENMYYILEKLLILYKSEYSLLCQFLDTNKLIY